MEEYVWISKVAHHELRQQFSLVSAMIENVPELALATDESGRIVYANAAAQRFCGHSKNEMMAGTIGRFFNLTRGQKTRIDQCVTGDMTQTFETTAVRKDGSRFPVQMSVSPMKSGPITRGLVIIATDISERKRSQKALIESHIRFLTVLDGIDADIYVSDLDTYEILLINRHIRNSFGENLMGLGRKKSHHRQMVH